MVEKTNKGISHNWFMLDHLMNLLFEEEVQHFELSNTPYNTSIKISLFTRTDVQINTFHRKVNKLGTEYRDRCNLHLFYNEYTKTMIVTIATI